MYPGKHEEHLGGRGTPGASPALSILDPHMTVCAHTHSPGAHRSLSAARSCSHRVKFRQLSTSQKGGVSLMHHSFHGGGHLACSPSSGALLHDCPPFPYRGLSRVLKNHHRPAQHHSPNSRLTNRKLKYKAPQAMVQDRSCPLSFPAPHASIASHRPGLCGETGASSIAQDTIVNHNC